MTDATLKDSLTVPDRPSLAELRAMLKAATPGPWLLETSAGGYMPSIIQSDRRQIVCLTGQAPMTDPEGRPVTELMMANARLIAEMHWALLPLLDIAEAALELPQRVTSYKLDEALAKVTQ